MKTMAFLIFVMTLISLFIFNANDMDSRNHRTLTPQELNELAMARADVLEAQANRAIQEAQSDEEIARINADKEEKLAQLRRDQAVDVATQGRLRDIEVENIKANVETSKHWASIFGSLSTVVVNIVGSLIALVALLYVFQDALKNYFKHREKMAGMEHSFQIESKQLQITQTGIEVFGQQKWAEIIEYARQNGYDPLLRDNQFYLVNATQEIKLLPD